MQLTYPINLMDFEEAQKGDVITKDGEFLGTWIVDEDDEQGSIQFVRDGESAPIFSELMVGMLCIRIAVWNDLQDSV